MTEPELEFRDMPLAEVPEILITLTDHEPHMAIKGLPEPMPGATGDSGLAPEWYRKQLDYDPFDWDLYD